jgi:hypothetical protein
VIGVSERLPCFRRSALTALTALKPSLPSRGKEYTGQTGQPESFGPRPRNHSRSPRLLRVESRCGAVAVGRTYL